MSFVIAPTSVGISPSSVLRERSTCCGRCGAGCCGGGACVVASATGGGSGADASRAGTSEASSHQSNASRGDGEGRRWAELRRWRITTVPSPRSLAPRPARGTYVCVRAHLQVQSYSWTHAHAHINKYKHAYIMHTCTCTHTHALAHIHVQRDLHQLDRRSVQGQELRLVPARLERDHVLRAVTVSLVPPST